MKGVRQRTEEEELERRDGPGWCIRPTGVALVIEDTSFLRVKSVQYVSSLKKEAF